MRPGWLLLLAPWLAATRAGDLRTGAAELRLGVATGLEKLRPGDPIPSGRAIGLQAAKGECESAQIAVRSDREVSLAASAAPLAGPTRIAVTLYRVATVPLSLPSGPDGAAGEWPDPLIPSRDPWFGEARHAFPVKLAPGRLQAIWVELCVPRSAPSGVYRGSVSLRVNERIAAQVPVELSVWAFSLPATSTFPAAFGLSTALGTQVLGRRGSPELSRALAAAALRHRVTPFVLSADPPTGRCEARSCALDFSAYDAEMAPILDGTLVPGTRGTFAEVRLPASLLQAPDAVLTAALRAWRIHFESRGWADRLWLYTLDEPSRSDLPELARRARAAHAAGVRVFATTLPDPALDGLVDAYVPNVRFFEDAGAGRYRSRTALRADPRPFWYASCMSHGCSEPPASGRQRAAWARAFSGWPGYEIDRPGAAARALGWLAYRLGVAGELYYDMLQSWRTDPWKDVRAFAGNGDGTLLYPGRPGELGGTHPFPVESIRLKIIRDGLEDYEMLALARRSGLAAMAERLAAEVTPSPLRAAREPSAYLSARRELGEALSRALAGASSSGLGGTGRDPRPAPRRGGSGRAPLRRARTRRPGTPLEVG